MIEQYSGHVRQTAVSFKHVHALKGIAPTDCCVSCRPAYLALGSLRADFAAVPIAAVTATATPQVIQDVKQVLCLKDPKVIQGSFNRQNIEYQIRYKELIGDGTDDHVLQVQLLQLLP